MLYFKNDYSEGAHPKVLEAIVETNMAKTVGYGEDEYCEEAIEIIRSAANCPQADIHFLVGGTTANIVAISACLRPFEAVISAETGHICVHEAGAIETAGHKILTVPTSDGKLSADLIAPILRAHSSEHMVVPKLVYISNVSETGTIYSKAEIAELSAFCKENDLLFFIDGARLGPAIYASGDILLEDFAQLCDLFYIGGTKNGLLFGEALVVANDAIKPNFRHYMKQHGGILAKGRLLGIQFASLFENSLFYENSKNSVDMMQKAVAALTGMGIDFLYKPEANMCFPILQNHQIIKLAEEVKFEMDAFVDEGHRAVRLVASWATTSEDIDSLVSALGNALS
ncbi:MAG: aminotransferase class I/II-fold pyridoxal phosphate-dependent enzyme [Eubacteriaceae bacterium]|nr:aminotransferase class I/II-fold pyridoxal phosphate-dependent enzyme [Eubacteriaceae bacterium]